MAQPADVPGLKLGERALRDRAGAADRSAESSRRSGSRGIGRRRSPRSRRSGRRRTGRWSQRRIEVIERNRNIGLIERPECKRRWQSEPWEDKEARRAHDLAAGPVRGAVTVVRHGWRAGADDGEPAGRPAAHGCRRGVGGAPAARPGRGPGRRAEGDHRRGARPVPGPIPVQAVRPGQAPPVGADLGPAARRGRDRQEAGHRRPAEVRGRRLPEAVLLAPPRQARRAQGALHLLPRRQPRQRPELPADRLGRLGPPRAGRGPDHADPGALGR